METQGKRLRYYIEESLLETCNSFSKRIGLNESNTIVNYCKDIYPISKKMLTKMVNTIENFPIEWIMTGRGEIPAKGSGFQNIIEMSKCAKCKDKDFIIIELKELITQQKVLIETQAKSIERFLNSKNQ